MLLAKVTALPSGKAYADIYELCNDLKGRVMLVTVGSREYNGRQQQEIKYMNPSKFPENHHVFKEKPTVTADTVAQRPAETFAGKSANVGSLDEFQEIIGDDDVPF